MTSWNLKYNYPLVQITGFKSFDDRMAHLKYGFAKVLYDKEMCNAIITSPNGDQRFNEIFYSKIENFKFNGEQLFKNNIKVERLIVNHIPSEHCIIYGDILLLKNFQQEVNLNLFSNFGIDDILKSFSLFEKITL